MDVKDVEKRVMMQTYARYDLTLARGKGARLWDDKGREYLDFVAGIAVCNLGHSHDAVNRAICEQAGILTHVSNLYFTEPQTRLAQALIENSFADRVFFANSGAEANEAAIKLARKYAKDHHGAEHSRIISAEMSFHGRTMATLTATGQQKVKIGFDPLLEGFSFIPFNDLPAAEKALDDRVCAVLVEPIQGEGGVNVPAPDYLSKLKRLCHDRGALLIFDEVQVGMGRTGTLFAYENFGVTPDIMTLAKAIANGLPMGAALATEEVAASFTPGTHATTFGGTPLVSAAALAVVHELVHGGVLDNCKEMGARLEAGLRNIARKVDGVVDVRGMGLIWAMELNRDVTDIVKKAQEHGLLINKVQDKAIRFIPPLIITASEVDEALETLEKVLRES